MGIMVHVVQDKPKQQKPAKKKAETTTVDNPPVIEEVCVAVLHPESVW